MAIKASESAHAGQLLALGYLQAHLLMTENELADLKDDLERFADKQGYALGQVFVERVDQVPAAFGALLEAIDEQGPKAIVVPSALHLAPLGLPPQLTHHLEATTGVRVLLASRYSP